MPPSVLGDRKKALANELNQFISMKKEVGQDLNKDELFAGAVAQQEENHDGGCKFHGAMQAHVT